MKVLLDEGVPRQLARYLNKHVVSTVPEAGWASAKNGVLLGLLEGARFEAFLTCDKNMQYQQRDLDRRPFAILVLSNNHWTSMQPHVERVVEAVEACRPGKINNIECGVFLPRKFRKPS